MYLESLTSNWNRLRAVNETTASLAANTLTATSPAGFCGVNAGLSATARATIELSSAALSSRMLYIKPFAIGSDGNTFHVQVLLWRQIAPFDQSSLWNPDLMFTGTCTVSGSIKGVAGRVVLDTELFADTIAIVGTSGLANRSFAVVSPADDANAGLIAIPTLGARFAEVKFDLNSSATSCNCLWAVGSDGGF